jgi:hypothetical protein
MAIGLLLIAGGMSGAQQVTPPEAWAPGEELGYTINFLGLLKAGDATFSVKEGPLVDGRPTYQFRSTLISAPRFFHQIRDEAASTADRTTFASYRYEKIQREKDATSTNVTIFDHGRGSAVRTEDGRAHAPIRFKDGALDVLSVIYYVRTQEIQPGQTLTVPVHDGKRDYTMKIRITGPEMVNTRLGSFRCLSVQPLLYEANGTLRRKGQMRLWMTDDHRRIPVRINMSLPFGSLTASISSMKGERPAAR